MITTHQHDGVALWDTQVAYPDGSIYSTVTATPASRDLVTPYVEAMRRAGIKLGLYFSHLDWHHPEYATSRPPADEFHPGML